MKSVSKIKVFATCIFYFLFFIFCFGDFYLFIFFVVIGAEETVGNIFKMLGARLHGVN